MWTKSILLFLFNYSISVLYGQAIDKSFVSPLSSNDVVFGMALQPDGKIIIGGNFSTSGIISKKLVRLNPNGTIDSSFNVGSGFTGSINEITLQTDGKLLVGGFFTALNNRPVRNLVRLLPDGTLDNSFNIGTGVDGTDNSVQYIKVDENGKIYVGGGITRFNGKSANMLIRLNSNGTLDSSFTGTAEYRGRVITFAFQPDGKILVGGVISKPSSPVVAMIRLESNGSLDNIFVPSSTTLNSVNSIVVLPNNKILAGGDFQNYNGKPYSSIVRLEANGAVDESFSVGTGFYASTGGIYSYPLYMVSDMALTNEGKIVVVGYFEKYNGTNVDGIIQLNPDGSINNTFQACNRDGLFGTIYDVIVQPDRRILVSGAFGDFRNNPIATNVFRLLPNFSSSEPISNFDYILSGKDVTFINASQNAKAFEWNFNDGTYSSLSNPLHKFKNPGSYNVRLTTLGLCNNSVTITKTVRIPDIQNIFPSKGGNTGGVTIKIEGAGFSNKSKVKLVSNNVEIVADTAFTNNKETVLTCYFNLVGKTIGLYDVIVEDNSILKSLNSSFIIESGQSPTLFVDLIGRDVIRGGRKETFQISFGNKGNNDALAVPLFISGIPKNAKWSINSKIDTLIDDSTKVPIEVRGKDSSQIIPLIIYRLPAQTSFAVDFSIEVPVTESDIKLTAWINSPLINQSDIEGRPYLESSNTEECINGFIDIALDEAAEVLIPKKCVQEATKLFINTLREYYGNNGTFDPSHPNFLKAYRKHAAETGKAGLICAGDLSVGRVKKFYEVFIDPLINLHDLYKGLSTIQDCFLSIFKRIYESIINVSIVSSIDPNEKVGLTSNNDRNYIKGITPLNYTVYFENKASARAAAQEVIIVDTIDKSKVDISSLQLQSFSFGKSLKISIPPGLQAYSRDTILQRLGKPNLLVRITAKIDTSKGILQWRFISLDYKTGEIINDPLDGFLPPNVNAPEGEGNVSYSIMPKSSLLHLTEIKNKATIYFDYNDPITTNEFLNTIDKVNPISKVEPLQSVVSDTTFKVIWGGNDVASGVRSYDIYYSVNNSLFKIWKYDVSATEGMFTGKLDSTYNFYSIAKDYAGNTENAKQSAEATTQVKMIVTGVDNVDVNGHFYLYPNPSQYTVNIDFNFPTAEKLTIVIRDIMGRIVATLLSDELTLAGKNVIPFNASTLLKGVYLCELKSKKYNKVLKFIKE